MGDYNKYKKLANLADIVRTASFGIAAYEDYGYWQLFWGLESFVSAHELFFPKKRPIRLLGLKFPNLTNILAGSACLAFAGGSLLTGDPRNAMVYGGAGIGFFSNFLSRYFKAKAKDVELKVDEVENKKLKKILRKSAVCRKYSYALVYKLNKIYNQEKLGWRDKKKLKEIKKEVECLEQDFSELSTDKYKDEKDAKIFESDKWLVNTHSNYIKEKLEKYDLSENTFIKTLKKTGWYVKKGVKVLDKMLLVGTLSLFSYFAVKNWDTYKDYFQDKTKYAGKQVTKDGIIISFLEKSNLLNQAYLDGDNDLIKKLTNEMNFIKGEVEDRLEDLIECDLSLLMKEKVNIATSFARSKCILLLSKKYDLGILNFYSYDLPVPGTHVNPYMYRRLTDFEKMALQRLGESMGLKAKRLPVDSKEFLELTELIKKNYNLKDKSLENKIEDKTNEIAMSFGLSLDQIKENREEYSIYIGQIGGLTLNLPFFQLIQINDTLPSLYDTIFVYGHETGHAYFMKNSNFIESLANITGLVLNTDKAVIEETAADMVGELCVNEFIKNHLKQDSELRKMFLKYMSTPKANQNRFSLVETFEKLKQEGKYDELDKYLDTFNENMKNQNKGPYTCINSATISMVKKYSGNRDVSEKVRYLAYELGLKGFVEAMSSICSYQDLNDIYDKLKN